LIWTALGSAQACWSSGCSCQKERHEALASRPVNRSPIRRGSNKQLRRVLPEKFGTERDEAPTNPSSPSQAAEGQDRATFDFPDRMGPMGKAPAFASPLVYGEQVSRSLHDRLPEV